MRNPMYELTECIVPELLCGGTAPRVPPVVARLPWQYVRHGGEEEVHAPCDDDVVIDADTRVRDHHGVAQTCVQRINHRQNYHGNKHWNTVLFPSVKSWIKQSVGGPP